MASSACWADDIESMSLHKSGRTDWSDERGNVPCLWTLLSSGFGLGTASSTHACCQGRKFNGDTDRMIVLAATCQNPGDGALCLAAQLQDNRKWGKVTCNQRCKSWWRMTVRHVGLCLCDALQINQLVAFAEDGHLEDVEKCVEKGRLDINGHEEKVYRHIFQTLAWSDKLSSGRTVSSQPCVAGARCFSIPICTGNGPVSCSRIRLSAGGRAVLAQDWNP